MTFIPKSKHCPTCKKTHPKFIGGCPYKNQSITPTPDKSDKPAINTDMEKKQQHTPIGFSRHILHPSDAELTKQADILYPNDPIQQQAYVNGGVWMRNGYNEDRFLKQFEGQASIIPELQQRIASLTEQVEQKWMLKSDIDFGAVMFDSDTWLYNERTGKIWIHPKEFSPMKSKFTHYMPISSPTPPIPALTKKGE